MNGEQIADRSIIMAGERVCLIGSGPSGMAFLYHLEKLRQEGKAVPEVVCFEKAADWGGLWNYDWRTGSAAEFDYLCSTSPAS